MKNIKKIIAIVMGVITFAASIYFIVSKLSFFKEKHNKSTFFVRDIFEKKEDTAA